MNAPIPDLKPARVAAAHLAGELLVVAETAAVYRLDRGDAQRMAAALTSGDTVVRDELGRLGLDVPEPVAPGRVDVQPIRALALTVSQTCNLACGYCYAAGGSFGGAHSDEHQGARV